MCVCIYIRGYYNTTLESEDTHATSTIRTVLQPVEEHFIQSMGGTHAVEATTVQELVNVARTQRQVTLKLAHYLSVSSDNTQDGENATYHRKLNDFT